MIDFEKLRKYKSPCGNSPWCEEDRCRCDEWEDAEADKVFKKAKKQ